MTSAAPHLLKSYLFFFLAFFFAAIGTSLTPWAGD